MKKVFLWLSLVVVSISACVGPFYESDYGKNIALPVGTPFEIRLEGDPQSEYTWKINDLDTTVIKMVLPPVFKPYDESDKTGGIYSFYFQTVGEGKTKLEMIYDDRAGQQDLQENSRIFSMAVESRI